MDTHDIDRECLFFDKETRTYIRFETKADAMLAAFVFGGTKHAPQLWLSTLDSLLQLFRNPKFITNNITLRTLKGKVFRTGERSNFSDVYSLQADSESIDVQDITEIGVSPPETETDALLGAFILSEERLSRLEINVVDVLLTLLRNPRFETNQVTFSGGQDILLCMAESRRNVASLRSLKPVYTSSGLPATLQPAGSNALVIDILEHVFELLEIDSRGPKLEERRILKDGFFFLPSGDLKAASLVHRSWTYPAQRALRRSLEITGSRGHYIGLRNPLVGAGTRQLRIRGYLENDERQEDIFFLLKSLPRFVPNLTFLSLDTTCQTSKPSQLVDEAILHLGDLKCLNHLEVVGSRCPPTLLESIAQMLSLKSLAFFASDTIKFVEEDIPAVDQKWVPPSSLREISITFSLHLWRNAPWLFRPHGQYRLKKLSVLWDHPCKAFSYRFLHPSMPQLEELVVDIYNTSLSDFEQFADTIFSHCSSLRVIRVRGISKPTEFICPSVTSLLPLSLEVVEICSPMGFYPDYSTLEVDWDALLLGFIESFPKLRMFSFIPGYYFIPDSFPETEAYCLKHKIMLSVAR